MSKVGDERKTSKILLEIFDVIVTISIHIVAILHYFKKTSVLGDFRINELHHALLKREERNNIENDNISGKILQGIAMKYK